MDTNKLPFGAGNFLPFNKPAGEQQPASPLSDLMPKLPVDLGQIGEIGKGGGLLDKATTAYCVAEHPELYTYAALGGAGASLFLVLALVGLFAFIGKLRRMVRVSQ